MSEHDFWLAVADAYASGLDPVSPFVDALFGAREALDAVPTGDHWL